MKLFACSEEQNDVMVKSRQEVHWSMTECWVAFAWHCRQIECYYQQTSINHLFSSDLYPALSFYPSSTKCEMSQLFCCKLDTRRAGAEKGSARKSWVTGVIDLEVEKRKTSLWTFKDVLLPFDFLFHTLKLCVCCWTQHPLFCLLQTNHQLITAFNQNTQIEIYVSQDIFNLDFQLP